MIPFNTGQICPFTSQLQIMRKGQEIICPNYIYSSSVTPGFSVGLITCPNILCFLDNAKAGDKLTHLLLQGMD